MSKDRDWERSYRGRWAHDKVVRSTHGVNCTGSCSWNIYVKQGIVTWEMQATDYPIIDKTIPPYEPRGCQRGISCSWYIYSPIRVKHPYVRGVLMDRWRAAKKAHPDDPAGAWRSIMDDPDARTAIQQARGKGGFRSASWDEVNEIIAAANVSTITTYGPDRIVGFSPIPAMSMVSYAAGSRYLSLIGGVCMSFYDWYCDLPPSSPQTWGEQTDVPESADWYNSTFLIAWGSNVPQTRTPDAHFFSEVRYKGAKVVAVTPDYAEVSKLADLWLHPKQGTDAALAMAMGHVIVKEFHVDRRPAYFADYARRYTDLPLLVQLEATTLADGTSVLAPGRYLRASDFDGALAQDNNPEWKTVAFDETGAVVVPNGSVGFRWGGEGRDDTGRWNLENREAVEGRRIELRLSLLDDPSRARDVVEVGFPYFGGIETPYFPNNEQGGDVLRRRVPAAKLQLVRDGRRCDVLVATVFDLLAANYGVARAGIDDPAAAASYDSDCPYTPAWQEAITGVPRDQVIAVARQFAENAEKTQGKSMVIIGAAMNHWYHCDMNYRGIINMLMLCGCVGQSGGGWAHYVGQEKLRPQTGWQPLAFALDWIRPSRQQNSTSFFYAHTDQWRYERLGVQEIVSPLADRGRHQGSMIDYNVRAERMGWLPSAPQLRTNPLALARDARAAGVDPRQYVVDGLARGSLELSCEDPDDPANWPRNLFVWRSNLLGSSGKGHEYFLRHLLGTSHGVQGKDLGADDAKPAEVKWHAQAPEGKLDL
ncbi:MAG TPA: nitrate reductase subunit alpha, partial [Acidimicrobiales bacterium]